MKPRPRAPCPRCGKMVARLMSGRTAAVGEPAKHTCPHGIECVGMSTEAGSISCERCARPATGLRAHVAHRFSTWETANYGGGDHIVVDEPVDAGRLHRSQGDPLCKPARSWPRRGDWSHGEEARGPNCKQCQEIARRLGISDLIGRDHVYVRRDGDWVVEPVIRPAAPPPDQPVSPSGPVPKWAEQLFGDQTRQ